MPSPPPDNNRRPGRKTLLWILVIGGIVLVLASSGGVTVRFAVDFIRSAARGADGLPAQVLVYGLASLFTFLMVFLPLPVEAAAFLNGGLFPSSVAFSLTWTMAMAGAAASYEIGRWLGWPAAVRIFGAAPMDRVERMVDKAGWPTLLALRLSPIMAFTAINWASGILALSRPVFYWTTAVGLVPGTYVFTVVPELLESDASTARLIGIAVAAAIGLLSISYLRIRRTG